MVIRKVFLYHQALKATHWSETFLIWRSTNLGSSLMDGVKPTVKTFIIDDPFLHKYKITGYFRWYNTPQCPWPALRNIKFLGSHLRLVWEEIFKLFGQKTNDYVQWIVCIKHFAKKRKRKITDRIVEWMGRLAWHWCHTACGGENIEDYFTNISTVMQWLNTNLSKNKRFKLFYVDY